MRVISPIALITAKLMKRIKQVVVIGSGRWAKVYANEISKCFGDSIDLYFCVARRIDEIRDWANDQELLSEVQIVDNMPSAIDHGIDIAFVINSAHDLEKAIKEALLKGYHVIVEKPLTVSSAQTEQVAELAHRLGQAVFSTNTYRFASYLQDFRNLLPSDKSITRMNIVWTDPAKEERYGESKNYDPRVPIIMDILPHIVSIFEAIYQFEAPILRSFHLKRGGAEVDLDFAFNHIESHIQISRVSDKRRRILVVWHDSVCHELDFSAEPGIVSSARKFVIDPSWENKTKPIASMIYSVINYFENGVLDSRLSIGTAIKANQLIDMVLPTYRIQQARYLLDNCCERNSVQNPNVRYALVECIQQSRKLTPEHKEFIYPMDVYFCNDCRSVQTLHDVDIHEYYSSYQYVASNSMFIRQYMERLARESFLRFGIKPGDAVIEIGAADGYMLSCFRDLGAKVLGYEAAENLAVLARELDIPVLTKLFTAETVKEVPEDFRQVQVVILLHTFDHLTDPGPFLDTVKQILDPERGVLLIEVHDLQDIVKKCEAALFGHEHATYFHIGSINRLLTRKRFKILDYNFINKRLMRGSSMLIAAGLEGCNLSQKTPLNIAAFDALDQLSTLKEFNSSIARAYSNLRSYIASEKNKGRRLAGYGGWGRGVTTLAMAGLDKSYLEFVVDKNPNLHGCFMPATHLEIVSPSCIDRARLDEVIVFNYAYLDEIRDAHKKFMDEGGVIKSVIDVMGAGNNL